MTISPIDTDVNTVLSSIQDLKTEIKLDLIEMTKVSETAYKVVLSHFNDKAHKAGEYKALVASMFGNRISLVEGSVTRKNVGLATQVQAFVIPNTVVQDCSEEVLAGMSVVTANVFMETASGNLWNLKETDQGKVLVRSMADDLEEMLAQRRSLAMVTASIDPAFGSAEHTTGDYAAFFHEETASVQYGFIAKTEIGLMAFAGEDTSFSVIPASAIISHVPASNMYEKNVGGFGAVTAGTIKSEALNKYLALQRKLFGGSDYFTKLNALIRKETGLGDTGMLFV